MNLGNDCVQAAARLRGNPDWRILLDGLAAQIGIKMETALASEPALAATANAYTRGLYDTWVALEAATAGINPRVVKKDALRVPASRRQPVTTTVSDAADALLENADV